MAPCSVVAERCVVASLIAVATVVTVRWAVTSEHVFSVLPVITGVMSTGVAASPSPVPSPSRRPELSDASVAPAAASPAPAFRGSAGAPPSAQQHLLGTCTARGPRAAASGNDAPVHDNDPSTFVIHEVHELLDSLVEQQPQLVPKVVAPQPCSTDPSTWHALAPEFRCLESDATAPVCSDYFKSLVADYKAFHAAGRHTWETTGSGPSTLVYLGEKGGGWGDRMPSLASAFAFALRYHRLLFVKWDNLTQWVAPATFDWTLRPGSLPALERAVAAAEARGLYGCENHDDDTPQACLWRREQPDALFTKPVEVIFMNRGIFTKATNPAGTKEHMAYFLSLTGGDPTCIHHALLRPTQGLWDAFKPQLDSICQRRVVGQFVVALHERMGDWSFASSRRDEQVTLDQMHEETRVTLASCAAAKDTQILFLSDNAQLRAAVQQSYPDRIIRTGITPVHVGNEELASSGHPEALALRDMLGEWWLMTACDAIVVSMFSGFARTAAAFTPEHPIIVNGAPCHAVHYGAKDAWRLWMGSGV